MRNPALPPSQRSTRIISEDGNVWMLMERGELVIGGLTLYGFHTVSRAKLIDPTQSQLDQRGGVCWPHPALAYRCVFACNDKELLCADLAAKP